MDPFAQQVYRQVGLKLTHHQMKLLAQYEQELLVWNERFNLTAIRDIEEVRVKHFLDSLTCVQAMKDIPGKRMVDIGSGAGFPGLVLKIVYPGLQLTLVDSVGKKIDFCRHMVETLGLEQVETLQERAENIGQSLAHREQYDWAVARAVAALPVLAEYLLPLVRIGGRMLAMKGENGPVESHTAEHALQMLGGHLRQLLPVTLPGVAEERYLVIIDKVAATPTRYPRRVGIPSKRPLRINLSESYVRSEKRVL
jgi:16S rRNA (guanine527-N7)-methyltransferase